MKKYIEPEIFVIAFDVEDSVSFGFGDNNQGVSGLAARRRSSSTRTSTGLLTRASEPQYSLRRSDPPLFFSLELTGYRLQFRLEFLRNSFFFNNSPTLNC